MFTFSFEDVSSTAAAAKGRNHSAEGDVGKLTSWVFYLAGNFVFWFLFYFLFTQRQCETMHLRFLALDPCCSEEKYFFDLNRNMNMTI